MKIGLIEVYTAHAECLYTQLEFLKQKYDDVTLICPTKLKPHVKEFHHNKIIFKDLEFSRLGLKEYKQFINEQCFDLIIFNTAQGELKKLFFSLAPFKCKRIYGVLHNVAKLKGSIGQFFINQHISGYFVLSDYIKRTALTLYPKGKFEVFYPTKFPNFKQIELKKKDNEIWITIPGSLEFYRRDFEGFFLQLKKRNVNKNIRFILLGRSTHKGGKYQEAIQFIQDAGLDNQFLLFEQFVPNDLFHSYLNKTDYILPLLHPSHASGKDYQYKISGSFNLAYSYNIPLLLHSQFKTIDEFQQHPTIFYETECLIESINTLKKEKPVQTRIPTFETQTVHYLNFLEEI